jgi:hypothetical protein
MLGSSSTAAAGLDSHAPADRLPHAVVALVNKPSVLEAARRPISSASRTDRAGAAVQPMPAGIEGGR